MFGSFGSASNTNSAFSAQNPQQQQPAGGLFGNASAQAQTQTSLFGAPANQGATSNIFGQQQQQQQQPQAGGGLFGQNNAQAPGQPAAGGSLFGGQQAGTSLFGNSTANTQPQQGSSLFGNPAANQPQQQGTNLFGASAQPAQPAGGLFGQSTANNANANPFAPKPGLFGGAGGLSINTNTNANANNSSLFGGQQQQQQQQQQQPAQNIFGQPQQQQQQPQPSLFSSTFGQQPQNNLGASSNPLFGNSALGTSMLGQSALGASSLMASRTPSSAPQNQTDSAQAQFSKLIAQIEGIASAWNSNSPECRFQHYFYNFVDPSQVKMYGRPPNATNESLWQQALRENPDPSCHVPVLAIGFDDVRQRAEAQTKKASEQQEQLKQLKERLQALKQRHATDNSSRLLRASTVQTQLTHRLLTLIQHLHLLIPSLRSSAIRPEEEELRGKLESIEEELKRSRGKGKLNELWALVGAINAVKERSAISNPSGSGEWVVVDEEGLAQIASVLSEQQAGLVHLTKILQKSIKDLNVVMGRANSATDEVYEVDRDELWGSLRASALR